MCWFQLRHEFSLCRVYIISGSFRAFDRRPVESTREMIEGDEAGPSNENAAAMVEERAQSSSSPETSCSGDLACNPMAGNWEMNQHPLWEWEPYNWPQ